MRNTGRYHIQKEFQSAEINFLYISLGGLYIYPSQHHDVSLSVVQNLTSFIFRFEKYKSNGNPMFAFAGYMTVYRYYAYPERIRPRISQVLIMPPFQRLGHGARLMQTFYDEAIRDPEVLDITGKHCLKSSLLGLYALTLKLPDFYFRVISRYF